MYLFLNLASDIEKKKTFLRQSFQTKFPTNLILEFFYSLNKQTNKTSERQQ